MRFFGTHRKISIFLSVPKYPDRKIRKPTCVTIHTRKKSALTEKLNLFYRCFKNAQKKMYARTEKYMHTINKKNEEVLTLTRQPPHARTRACSALLSLPPLPLTASRRSAAPPRIRRLPPPAGGRPLPSSPPAGGQPRPLPSLPRVAPDLPRIRRLSPLVGAAPDPLPPSSAWQMAHRPPPRAAP